MKALPENTQVSQQLYDFVDSVCQKNGHDTVKMFGNLTAVVKEFAPQNQTLLKKRVALQDEVDSFFKARGQCPLADVVAKLKDIGYIAQKSSAAKVAATGIDTEIYPMAGPQLVVPADKVNMVLNAANARWQSLYDALYVSNIIDETLKDEERKQAVIAYTGDILDNIAPWEGVNWKDATQFVFDRATKKLTARAGSTEAGLMDAGKLVGLTFAQETLSSLLLENHGLKIEIRLENGRVKDVLLEAALTYIIDLEDASISAPENKYEGYRILRGIADGTLDAEVRGKLRVMNADTEYLDAKTLAPKSLKRTALPLVRDVGPHMVADAAIITVDGKPIPEKILDCFITSLIGHRYHVVPKMHGAEEVRLNVELWDAINARQGLAKHANKMGIMNEELRTNAQLQDAVLAARDMVFFTNTGFLDYTGSFIDLMMHQGPIAPYRTLPAQAYKSSYELHNVNVSLSLGVPQIGAGMWAAIKDMKGLMKSKEAQVRGLTDTGWSPSPMAAAIHALAFHLVGDVRAMQAAYAKDIKPVNVEDMFTFPAADLAALGERERLENLDFAIHGLLAYAEPWVRRGIGCSGVKDLAGEPLMEDRATARIKAAFVRNWLLHKVVSAAQVEDSIRRMAALVDGQNSAEEGYRPLVTPALGRGDWSQAEEAVRAVYDVVFNADGARDSYVEAAFYGANRREVGRILLPSG